jgi:cell division protease FtsH
MSEAIGPLALLPEDGPLPYPGAVEVAPDTVKRVDDEVKRIVDDALDEVRALLAENRERLDGLAAALLGTERLGAEEAYAAAVPFRDGSQAREPQASGAGV